MRETYIPILIALNINNWTNQVEEQTFLTVLQPNFLILKLSRSYAVGWQKVLDFVNI